MPRRRNDPDPLEDKRRELAERERVIAEKLARIGQGLDPDAPPEPEKPAEPPVWRLEEDGPASRPIEMLPSRNRRHLAAQRQRDKMLFFIAFGILIIVMSIVVWVACFHDGSTAVGP